MTTFRPPTDEELIKEARTFLKGVPSRYRSLRASGDLEEVINLKVAATKDHAEVLIDSGVFESKAWFAAIREKILERDPD
jgi:hypothetical protein